jgi:hypothetical protein
MTLPLLTLMASCADVRPSTSLLFAPDEARLDRDHQQQIVNDFAEIFLLSPDGRSFADPNCGNVDPETTLVDLNGDGVFEVFIQWGNSCTSGGAGRSLSLFVSDTSGTYRPQLGFPALGWSVLRSEHREWPDLRFGGPGFCHPVWRWQQGEYAFQCNLPEEPGGCAGRGNVCEAL